jgi:hypothetical protein
MGILFNRQDDLNDVVESGIYQVPIGSAVHLGYPAKDAGSIVSVDNPPYTRYKAVADYTDTTDVAQVLGVSENTILESLPHPSLRNIEWRHLPRDVTLVKRGVRLMRNKDPAQATVNDSSRVAPTLGGFQKWQTGMQKLGVLKRGPCAYDELGMIAVDIDNVQV